MTGKFYTYWWKSWLAMIALYIASNFLHRLTVLIAVWLIVGIANAVIIMYQIIVHKNVKERQNVKGRFLSWLNNRKMGAIICSIIVSLITTFALFFNIMTWFLIDWLAVFCYIFVFYGLYKFVRWLVLRQKNEAYHENYTLIISFVCIPALFALFCTIIDYLVLPIDSFRNATEALYFYKYKNIL